MQMRGFSRGEGVPRCVREAGVVFAAASHRNICPIRCFNNAAFSRVILSLFMVLPASFFFAPSPNFRGAPASYGHVGASVMSTHHSSIPTDHGLLASIDLVKLGLISVDFPLTIDE